MITERNILAENEWFEIESSTFSKQYFHNGKFDVFAWAPKDFHSNMTTFSPYEHNNGHKRVNIKNIEDNKKAILLHRFLYQIFHPEPTSCQTCNTNPTVFNIFSTEDFIKHMDGENNNNSPENLKRFCTKCYKNEQVKKGGEKRKRRVIVYNEKLPHIIEEFSSKIEAGKKYNLSESEIRKLIKEKKTKNGYTFEYKKEVLIEDEIFKQIPDSDLFVSNKGRIQFPDGRINFGNKNEKYDNRSRIRLNGKSEFVSTLVLRIFEPESLIKKAEEIKSSGKYPECIEMTIDDIIRSTHKRYSILCDHIDRNPENNNIENLRWVTSIENAENTERVRPVLQYSLDGKTFINEFSSINDAGRELKTSRGNIGSVCNGKRKTAGGFFWKFKEIPVDEMEYLNIEDGTSDIGEEKEDSSTKKIQQFSADGITLIAEFSTQNEATIATKIQGISAVINGKRKLAGGFIWKMIGGQTRKIRPILQYSKDGTTLIAEFKTQVEAELVTGFKAQNISEACNGKQKSVGGYIFKFKET
jgi:HNH endonuclease/NUMOD1 domain